MFNYIPERIYNKIKDDADYVSLVAEITKMKESCTTLKSFIESEKSISQEKIDEYNKIITSAINKYCPEYLLQWQVNEGKFTNDQLLDMYHSEKYDPEYNLFFISKLNISCTDENYVPYLQQFVSDYEKLDHAILGTLYAYVHLKYMYAKIYMLSFLTHTNLDGYHSTLFNSIKAVHSITLKYADADIVNNYFLEAIADSVQIISNKETNIKVILSYLTLVFDYVDTLDFQYKDYSFGYVKLLDIRNMLYAHDRNYTEFYHGVVIVCKYLSTALAVPSKLLRGLYYYDKFNHALFVVLIRKYIKLKNSIPILRTSDSVVINNLSSEDYEYTISDIVSGSNLVDEHDSAIEQYRISVDKWFSSDNIAFSGLREIKS